MDSSQAGCPASAPLCRPHSVSSEAGLEKQTTTTTLKQYFRGWRSGLAISTSAAALVAIINVLFLVARRRRRLYTGDCKTAKQYSLSLHLGINILATVLLGAGNYTQQVLTAPTREEIDHAHGRMQWLDIGVSSLHNLGKISRKRVAAWTVLALSSLPIHLLYNSAVSFETSANEYSIYTARWEDLVDPSYVYSSQGKYSASRYQELRDSLGEFERLENSECIAAYNRKLISDRGDAILIVDPSTRNLWDITQNSTWMEIGLKDPDTIAGNWICDRSPLGRHVREVPKMCDVASSVDAENWTGSISPGAPWDTGLEPVRVDYCLSRPTPEKCRLIVSIPLLAIVIGCNAFKLVGLALTWLFLEQWPLLTLGDAMASFLNYPDPATKGRHLLSKLPGRQLSWEPGPRIWLTDKRRWAAAVSWRRYGVTVFLCAAALSAASFLLSLSVKYIPSPSIKALWGRGFGQVSVDCLVEFWKFRNLQNPMSMVLVSNSPQLIVSLLYTALNGMWTAMLVGVEWNSYGTKHKTLRTTYPVGQQRKTYRLSLPLRHGVPLTAASTALHWLISQSIFFVRLVAYRDGEPFAGLWDSETTCGYSPIAIVFSIALGSLILLATVGASMWTFTPAVPPGGTCSAVVSAACHAPEGDEDAALELVRRGVVPGGDHCSITSWLAEPPEQGRWYC